MKPLVINLALTGLWVLITGDASLVNAVVGFGISFLLLLWLWPHADRASYFRKLPQTLAFAGYFASQLVKSSLQVAREVVARQPRRKPAIFSVPLTATTDAEITLLMNLITLTPGTVVIDHDPANHRMWIHAMFAAQPDQVKQQIKDGFEKRVLELLR
jgi:multicomponent Na+:H+ antiporter subunit E